MAAITLLMLALVEGGEDEQRRLARVRIVPEADQALLWAASEAPDLVLVSVDDHAQPELLGVTALARRRGRGLGQADPNAPPADVMAVIADFESYPAWAKGVKTAEVTAEAVGGRAEQVAEQGGGFAGGDTMQQCAGRQGV